MVENAQRVLVYTSTMGLEAAMLGKDVVTSAQTHYRGLGFTRDAGTREEYAAMLQRAPQPLSPAEIARARRYAHTFFFHFAVPCPSFDEKEFMGDQDFTIDSFDELLSGKDATFNLFREGLFPLHKGTILVEGTAAH
jgi:hypothetical protein